MGHQAKKGLGQNWLSDSETLLAMVSAAGVKAGDYVLEIGPGLGYLTDKLLQAGANVHALEFDQDLIPKLQKKYAHLTPDRLKLEEADIRTFDLSCLPVGYKVCANIPYYLTANLLRLLTDAPSRPSAVALMVQKEVAAKVAARSGKRSMLAVLAQAWYQSEAGRVVSAELFDPAPKVDSQILTLRRREEPLVGSTDWPDLVRLVKMSYAAPRKKLRANLAAGLNIDKPEADEILTSAGIDVGARAEQLSDQDWLKLLAQTLTQIA